MKILLFDDHKLLGESLSMAISEYEEIQICDFVSKETEFYKALENKSYDILLLDINLKNSATKNGFEILEEINEKYPDMKIIILSSYDMPLYREKAFELGATDFINKSIEIEDLVKKLINAENEKKHHRKEKVLEKLTEREIEVLKEICTGKVKKDIAQNLFISERTLYNHIQNIYDKLQVSNTLEAYNVAIKLGYIEPLM